jgi:hypothetical protein
MRSCNNRYDHENGHDWEEEKREFIDKNIAAAIDLVKYDIFGKNEKLINSLLYGETIITYKCKNKDCYCKKQLSFKGIIGELHK